MVRMSSSAHARNTRIAISLRLATRILRKERMGMDGLSGIVLALRFRLFCRRVYSLSLTRAGRSRYFQTFPDIFGLVASGFAKRSHLPPGPLPARSSLAREGGPIRQVGLSPELRSRAAGEGEPGQGDIGFAKRSQIYRPAVQCGPVVLYDW